MIELALDASTYVGTAALWRDGALIRESSAPMRGRTEEHFFPMVTDLLEDAGVLASELDRVICGAGPGSFTSLRIAASIAKGLASAGKAELWAVPSLGLIVTGGGAARPEGTWIAVLDALRGDAYAGVYTVTADGTTREVHPARVVPMADVATLAPSRASVIGPGRAVEAEPHARGAARLIAGGCGARVDLDVWEPDYGRVAEAQARWEAAHGRPLSGA